MNLNFTLILQIASFLLLLGLMTKLLYKPLMNYLDERAKQIKDMTEGARLAEEKSKKYAEETHHALKMAKSEALKIKEDAKRLSDAERRRVIDEAKKQATFLIDEAKKQLGTERDLVLKKIRADIADISIETAKRLLSRDIDKKDHKRLIEESISEIENEISRARD
ncbi:MAG: F0F1 ATP synthase subunit B [Candidatus Omnitrophica bacterium]|nr:F0F1 ATP synthase subunit B [Candidatus Omnitrophota bacterium]